MATNSLLTLTQVTRASLVILHQKLNFVGGINRQYDDQFAKSGAKIGTQLKIRLPNKFVTRSGATFTANDISEQNTTLTVATQKGIDMSFTSAEQTLSIQDYTDRFIEPAMAQLAATIEADALTMILDVYQTVDNQVSTSMQIATVIAARQKLADALAPMGERTGLLTTQDTSDVLNNIKGLFQESSQIAKAYRAGVLGTISTFDFYESTLLANLTSGTHSASSTMIALDTIVPATATSTLNVGQSTAMGTFVKGDVFTIATLNRVHPESKADTGVLQQFVVTATTTQGTTAAVSISPPITMSGAYQNVISTAISGQAIVKLANTSRSLRQSLFFHKDAFAFVSADLVVPKGVHEAAREVFENISMRMVTFYGGSDDTFGTRLDVLYGYKTIRPELATKVWS